MTNKRNNRAVFFSKASAILLFCLLAGQLFAMQPDTFSINKGHKPFKMQTTRWFKYGFNIGVNVPLDLNYSAEDKLKKLFSAEFSGYFSAGKYVFCEIGLGYMFHKGTYFTEADTNSTLIYTGSNIVETRYLLIPVKAVLDLPFKKNFAVQPHIGIIYQPLIHVSKNNIDYGKNNITNHQLMFTAGLGVKIFFVTVHVNYRKMLFPFFSDRKSSKPSFINMQLGFQF